jgi:hypothetical protein
MDDRRCAQADEVPGVRARQTFRITAVGRRLLGALRRDVTELYEETVLGREPRRRMKAHPASARGRS